MEAHRSDCIDLDPSHYKLINLSIRTLEEMHGIEEVKLRCHPTNTEIHNLTVTGTDRNVCQTVIEEVKKRIGAVKTVVQNDDKRLKGVQLRPYKNDEEIVVVPKWNFNQSSQGARKLYLVSGFSVNFPPTDTYTSVPGPGNASFFLESTNAEGIKAAFEAGLTSNQNSGTGRLGFKVNPGKIYFKRPTGKSEPLFKGSLTLQRDLLTSKKCGSHMRSLDLRPKFTKQLTLPHFDLISRRLESLGFDLLTSYDEGFPVVYLDVTPRVTPCVTPRKTVHQFTATLALDENLKVFKTSANDPRMSEEKKEAVENILKANTIGELFADRTNAEIEFRKKSILIAATTNAHQGVENALEVLKDAKVKTLNGDPPTTPVIGHGELSTTSLPKVVKLRTKPLQICTLTTMSEKPVDVSARLITYGKDQENLFEEVRQALEEHSDRLKEPLSSKSGSIQMTSGKIEEMEISSVMKTSALKIYAKKVTVGHEQRILEVQVKKSRYRDLDNSIWKEEQLEFSFEFDDRKEGEHDENTLAEEFEELKNWVNTVFLENSSNENREPNSFI